MPSFWGWFWLATNDNYHPRAAKSTRHMAGFSLSEGIKPLGAGVRAPFPRLLIWCAGIKIMDGKTEEASNDNEIAAQNVDAGESSFDMDDLTENEALPEKNEAAVDAVRAAESEEAAKAQAEAQNPAPYGYTKAGKPAKKRGRKGGESVAGAPKPLNLGGASQQMPNERPSLPAAITISTMIEQTQVALISKDFVYTDMEREGNIIAWEKTCDHYGGIKIHPVAELAMSHIAIISARAAASSETQTKLALFSAWVKTKFKRKGKKDARASSGADAERQDDIRGKEDKGYSA